MAIKSIQMYRKNLDTSETNLYPLTEAQYVSMENGQTVQEILSDRDSDKYTPVITNSSSTFKVGQGDNVDLSSSMKEGAYDSCVLKGKTMVNCIQEPSRQDVVLPYEFEDGQYVTINDTKESGALGVELKGQTLVNLDKNTYPITKWGANENSNNYFIDAITLASGMFKPATKYLFKIYGLSCDYDIVQLQGISGQFSQVGSTGFVFNKNGSLVLQSSDSIQTLTSYTPHFRRNDIKNLTEQDKQNFKMIILEYQEGMENWDIPYFTGMTSVKLPILHTVGKNLFDEQIKNNADINSSTGVEGSGTRTISLNFTSVFPNTQYSITRPSTTGNMGVRYYTKHKEYIKFQAFTGVATGTFTTPTDCYFIKFIDEANTLDKGYQIECGSPTSYEPYKTSILSLPEEVVLRSLPNGVCDTFNTRTGVYTQRIGEVVLDGSENWSDYSTPSGGDDYISFSVTTPKLSNRKVGFTNSLCDGMKIDTSTSIIDEFIEPHPSDPSMNGWVMIRILKTRLSAQTVQGLREWLTNNPLTLQYELIAPIVTKINLSSTLKSWNTTTHIYSEIPENTLYPILSHSNPSYPVILKPSTKYSIVANSYSNNHTNSAINFNLGGATASTTVGNRVTTITTPSTLSNELLTMSGRGNKLNNVMVIEGDVVGDEPYFEGICDCKSPILLNVGKNLFDVDDLIKKHSHPSVVEITKTHSGFNMKSKYTGVWHATNYSMQLKPNTQYIFNCIANTKSNTGSIKLWNDCESFHVYRDAFLQNTTNLEINITFTTQKDGVVKFQLNTTRDISALGDIEVLNVSLYELANQTTYEPYKSNTTTFEQKDDKTIVLRSLPNGVCDTLNVETGEYIQRIGEVVLDGTQNWTLKTGNWEFENTFGFITTISDMINTAQTHPAHSKGNSLVCSHFPSYGGNSLSNNALPNDIEMIGIDLNRLLGLRITKTKLSTPNAEGLKTWLRDNPVTVQYELATPIVSTIDIQGFPYAYTNGHVQLSSGHSGQSLTPKVEYSLSANKTGQINSNTKRVSAHQKQLDDFEAMMLTQMVQSAYDKAILQFDYEMQMMSLGGE